MINSIKKVEEELSSKTAEANAIKEDEKKKEKKISSLKKLLDDVSKKKSDLKREVEKLDASLAEKKIIKFEEKIPEELSALQSKNEFLRKEISHINNKIDIEKN